MKRIFLILCLLSFTKILSGQDHKRTAIWYFGQNAGLDFNTDPPTPLTDGQINTDEGCATLCDTNGNLLLYSDGMTVWNGNHQIMINGTGLLGNGSSSQGVIIIPQPENDSIFFIFTTDYRGGSNGLRYSIANLNGNNGQGELTEKNVPLITPVSEAIAAVNHENGVDVWIVSHGFNNNFYYSYLLTKEKLVHCPIVVQVGSVMGPSATTAQNFLKFSPNGSKVANTFIDKFFTEILSFNNESGKVFNAIKISTFISTGIEFSPNSNVLYVGERDNGIYQFDLASQNETVINNSKKLISKPGEKKTGALQLAPNGAIITSVFDSSFVGVISSPNLLDTLCSFKFKQINISPKKSLVGLPGFNISYLLKPSLNIQYILNCSLNSIALVEYDTFGANAFTWHIIKQSSSIPESTSNNRNPTIQFLDTGWYTIKLIASNGSLADSVSKDIHIKPKYVLNLGTDTTICSGQTVVLNAGSGQHCYRWQDGSSGSAFLADTAGTYSVKVTTNNFCTYYDTIEVSSASYPSKPQITRNYDTLFSSYSDSWQWYRNTSLLAGENDSFIKITLNGFYQVLVKNASGCGILSDSFSVTNVNIGGIIQAEQAFHIFPNPCQGQLFIEPKENPELVYDVKILTVSGVEIFHSENHIGRSEINTHSLSPGLYMLKIITKENIYLSKIIIQSPN